MFSLAVVKPLIVLPVKFNLLTDLNVGPTSLLEIHQLPFEIFGVLLLSIISGNATMDSSLKYLLSFYGWVWIIEISLKIVTF